MVHLFLDSLGVTHFILKSHDFRCWTSQDRFSYANERDAYSDVTFPRKLFYITIYEKLVVPTVRSVALQTMSSENNRYGGTKSQQYSTSTAVWGNFFLGGGL